MDTEINQKIKEIELLLLMTEESVTQIHSRLNALNLEMKKCEAKRLMTISVATAQRSPGEVRR